MIYHIWPEGTNYRVDFYLELFAVILSFILFFGYSYQMKKQSKKEPLKKKYFSTLIIVQILTLLTNAFYFFYKDNPSYILQFNIFSALTYYFTLIQIILFHYFFYLSTKKAFNLGTGVKYFINGYLIVVILICIVLFPVISYFMHHPGIINETNLVFFFLISELLGPSILILDIVLIISNRKKIARLEVFAWTMYAILPLISLPLAIFISQVYLYLATFISLIVFYMTINVIEHFNLIEQENQNIKNNMILSKAQTDIMMSQIQPHFLFNALASISALCYFDAETAQKATNKFADYLRMNLNSIRNTENVLFSKELEHVQTYLWLEQIRFSERLKVEYDIMETEFFIPPLCIQPIVENAVKHGICAKPEGGTVVISTSKAESEYLITIKDDGVGFDLNDLDYLKKTHKGLNNCEDRIKNLCNGYFEITSKPQKGTTVVVHIPEN